MTVSQFLLFFAILLFTVVCTWINARSRGNDKFMFWILVLFGVGLMIGQLVAYIIVPILIFLL